MRINPDNKKIRYSGRIDWRNPKEPIWVYPCTSAEFKFTGKYLKIFLKNKNEYWQNYLGCILDGVQLCYYLDNKKENEIEIRVPENENGEHHVLFFKRQDSCHEMHILGFEIEDGAKLLELPDANSICSQYCYNSFTNHCFAFFCFHSQQVLNPCQSITVFMLIHHI